MSTRPLLVVAMNSNASKRAFWFAEPALNLIVLLNYSERVVQLRVGRLH